MDITEQPPMELDANLDEQMNVYIKVRDQTEEWREHKKRACAIMREKLDQEERPIGPVQYLINYVMSWMQ